jgi:hypothetical protein
MTPLPLRLFVYLRGDDGPLVGDLMEEYGRRRSALWLWRQVAVALATGAWSDLQRQPVDGLRAAVVLALSLPAVVALFMPLAGLLDRGSSGPVVYPRFDSVPPPWLVGFATSVFVTSVFCGRMAELLAGRFSRLVILSLGVAGTLTIVESAWFGAGVLWLYPWNGFPIFLRWAAINAAIGSLFLGGLYLGGWPRNRSGREGTTEKSRA